MVTKKGVIVPKETTGRLFPIWVLNLERSRARREYMEKQLKALNWPFELINAVDGQRLGPEELKFYSIQQAIQSVYRPLTPGEIACALSHARMWERMIADRIHEALILEDDIEIRNDLIEVLSRRDQFPTDWELINFRTDIGMVPFGLELYKGYKACHFKGDANRTCAYFINLKGAQKLLKHVYPIRFAADGLTGRTSLTKLVSYGIYPNVVELTEFSSEINLTLELRKVRKWWHLIFAKWSILKTGLARFFSGCDRKDSG